MKFTTNLFFACFFFMSFTLLFGRCSGDEEIEPEPVPSPPTTEVEVESNSVEGIIRNRANGEAIQGVKVILYKSCFLEDCYSTCSQKLSDFEGKFEFKPAICSNLRLDKNFTENFQSQFWEDDTISRNSQHKWESWNKSFKPKVSIELYPRTYANLHLTNVEPASDTDTIYFRNTSFSYTNNTPFISLFTSDGFGGYSTKGIHNNFQVEVEIRTENIFTTEYRVVTDTGTEEYSMTVECEPGGLTDIFIEY